MASIMYDDPVPNQSVKIKVERYQQLLRREKQLEALNKAGVHSWDGFEVAMEIYRAFK